MLILYISQHIPLVIQLSQFTIHIWHIILPYLFIFHRGVFINNTTEVGDEEIDTHIDIVIATVQHFKV